MRILALVALGAILSASTARSEESAFYAKSNPRDGSIDIVSSTDHLIISKVIVNRGRCKIDDIGDSVFILNLSQNLKSEGVTGEDFERRLREGIAWYKSRQKPYSVEFGETLHLATAKAEGGTCTVLEVALEANGKGYTLRFRP